MLYQPKSIRKYAAATVSAALVGSSFAPLANAAVFTDIDG